MGEKRRVSIHSEEAEENLNCEAVASADPLQSSRPGMALPDLRQGCRAFRTFTSSSHWMLAALGEQGSSLWLRVIPGEGVSCESSTGN